MRSSPDERRNGALRELAPASAGESNRSWLARTGLEHGVLLLGGSALADFRIRFAQSALRQDLLPSFWSLAGFVSDGEHLQTVADARELSALPARNAVQTLALEEFDDPAHYPNIALIQFTADPGAVRTAIAAIAAQRALLDLPALLLPWLGFVWGVGAQRNPLDDGTGLPGAALVETAHAMAGLDLTPGLGSAASSPEAIWQSARWWRSYYESAAAEQPSAHPGRADVPHGCYALRQPAAQVAEPAPRGAPGRAP